ncbi:MAG: hypothetical protein KatS3mg090_0619 [Patescibacteria group bacterium]|nr:MAG: hypothetical protein KatS3mg090_0619 [Patescibacteria group bacterium]
MTTSIHNFIKKTKITTLLRIIFLINLIIAISPLFIGEIKFHTDIARDFLLFDEIVKKKIVLIGPRASGLDGFFHGPLWLYLNIPFYIIGKGNPIIIGWGWIIMTISILFITKNLIGKIIKQKYSALLFITLFLTIFALHLNGLYNPYGALFLTIPFILVLYYYLETNKEKFLFISLIILGLMIHLQIATAGPFLISSLFIIIFKIIKNRSFSHLKSLLAIPLTTITYLLFDLRHNFQLSKSLLTYIKGTTNAIPLDTQTVILNRLNIMSNEGIDFFNSYYLNFIILILFLLTAIILILKLKNKNKLKTQEQVFLLTFYFYITFYFFSILHKGWLLYHYFLPTMSLPIFLLSVGTTLVEKKLKRIYIILTSIIIFTWTIHNIQEWKNLKNSIGQDENSWTYQSKIAQTVFEQNDREFGFFIFSPDILAYQTKASMNYYIKRYPNTKVFIYEKRPVTYLIIAPPPSDKPWLNYSSWKESKVNLTKEPIWKKQIPPVGYTIEKYKLDKKDLEIPTDPNINDWIHYR